MHITAWVADEELVAQSKKPLGLGGWYVRDSGALVCKGKRIASWLNFQKNDQKVMLVWMNDEMWDRHAERFELSYLEERA